MQPLPSRTVPRSAISGLGCRSGGKAAVMQPLPSRTVPRSAISGFGWHSSVGEWVVIDPEVSRLVEFISSLLDLARAGLPSLNEGEIRADSRTKREKMRLLNVKKK